MPLSAQARTIQLVGAELPIHVVFGQAGAGTYAAVRARAEHVTVGAHTALVP